MSSRNSSNSSNSSSSSSSGQLCSLRFRTSSHPGDNCCSQSSGPLSATATDACNSDRSNSSRRHGRRSDSGRDSKRDSGRHSKRDSKRHSGRHSIRSNSAMRVRERCQAESRQCEQYRLESGLPVYKVIDDTEASDPFLLFDHIGPVNFLPGEAVGATDHPHRGMELISVLLQGSIHHADSIGHDSVLAAGTVQHIRFGRGLVHFEMPGPALARAGGVLEGYQLWVNLPPSDKLCAPTYTELAPADVPRVRTEDGAAEIRVLAGASHGIEGALACVTPVQLLDVRLLRPGASLQLDVPRQYERAFVYCFSGAGASVADKELPAHCYATLSPGESLTLAATQEPCHLLVGAGVPLRQPPVVKFGPFAMASQEEIRQAVADYRQGLMGECPPPGAQERQRMVEAALAVQRANGKDV